MYENISIETKNTIPSELFIYKNILPNKVELSQLLRADNQIFTPEYYNEVVSPPNDNDPSIVGKKIVLFYANIEPYIEGNTVLKDLYEKYTKEVMASPIDRDFHSLLVEKFNPRRGNVFTPMIMAAGYFVERNESQYAHLNQKPDDQFENISFPNYEVCIEYAKDILEDKYPEFITDYLEVKKVIAEKKLSGEPTPEDIIKKAYGIGQTVLILINGLEAKKDMSEI